MGTVLSNDGKHRSPVAECCSAWPCSPANNKDYTRGPADHKSTTKFRPQPPKNDHTKDIHIGLPSLKPQCSTTPQEAPVSSMPPESVMPESEAAHETVKAPRSRGFSPPRFASPTKLKRAVEALTHALPSRSISPSRSSAHKPNDYGDPDDDPDETYEVRLITFHPRCCRDYERLHVF